jgi:hypothetical protein
MYKTYTKIDNIITNTDYSTDQKINRLSGIKIGKSTVKIGIHTASKIIKTYDNRYNNYDTYNTKTIRTKF